MIPALLLALTPLPPIEAQVAGQTLLAQVVGDLSGDGIADIAVITASPDAPIDAESPASLRVFFVNGSGQATLQVEAPQAACVHCGGMKGGDFPFALSIEKGVLVLRSFGGARDAFAQTTRWKLKEGDFRLIGITDELSDTIASEKGMTARILRDANVSTLKMDETVEKVGQKPRRQRCAVPARYRSYTLRAFKNDLTAPACSDATIE
jgi:hypothetical protein